MLFKKFAVAAAVAATLAFVGCSKKEEAPAAGAASEAVSYTHLTLPTILRV